jgi:hypothetical protein
MLERVRTISAGLADGTWVYDPSGIIPQGSLDTATITVFMLSEATIAQLDGVSSALRSLPGVERTEFVSKSEALDLLKEDFKDSPEVLDGLVGNPLPDSYKVWLSDTSVSAVEGAVQVLSALPGVDEVAAPQAPLGQTGSLFESTSEAEFMLSVLEALAYEPDLSALLAESVTDTEGLRRRLEAIPRVVRVEFSAFVTWGEYRIWVERTEDIPSVKAAASALAGIAEVSQALPVVDDPAEILDLFHQK